MLGDLRFGSELMTIRADRAQDGGLATIGYDDDGAPASSADFAIIEKGVFENFQMALGQAHLIGLPRSNGCAYADSPRAFPIQRMPNISLAPNPERCSLNDLISGVENGLYIVGAGSWSIDQQRDNFQFGGQLFFEIKNGELGEMVQGAAYQGRTLEFWRGLDGLGDASTMNFTASSPAARRSRCNSPRSRMARRPRAFAALGFSTPTRRRERAIRHATPPDHWRRRYTSMRS